MPTRSSLDFMLRIVETALGRPVPDSQRARVLEAVGAALTSDQGGSAATGAPETAEDRLRAAVRLVVAACGGDPHAIDVQLDLSDEPEAGTLVTERTNATVEPTIGNEANLERTESSEAGPSAAAPHRLVFRRGSSAGAQGNDGGTSQGVTATEGLGSGAMQLSNHPSLTIVTLTGELDELIGAASPSAGMAGGGARRSSRRGGAESIPDRLLKGKYRIEERLGGGGYGVVYKATQLGLGGGAVVAIKIVNRGQRTADELKVLKDSLTEEFQVISKLEEEGHPNVVGWKAIDETDDGLPFLVLQYVEGKNLNDVLKGSEATDPKVWHEVLLQVLDALRFVHAKGVLHLDLKPGNIMKLARTSRDGKPRIKLIDFGVSLRQGLDEASAGALPEAGVELRSGVGESGPSSAGASSAGSVGRFVSSLRRAQGASWEYASPEQCKHMRGDLDWREHPLTEASDLYSFGVVAYQLLSGKLPYAEFDEVRRRMRSADEGQRKLARLDAFRLHLEGTIVPLRDVAPSVDRRIARVVERCLSKDPNDRFGRVRPAKAAGDGEGGSEDAQQARATDRCADRCYDALHRAIHPSWWPKGAVIGALAFGGLIAAAGFGSDRTYDPSFDWGQKGPMYASTEDGPSFMYAGDAPDSAVPRVVGARPGVDGDAFEVIRLEGGRYGIRAKEPIASDPRPLRLIWEDGRPSAQFELGIDPPLELANLVSTTTVRVGAIRSKLDEGSAILLRPEDSIEFDVSLQGDTNLLNSTPAAQLALRRGEASIVHTAYLSPDSPRLVFPTFAVPASDDDDLRLELRVLPRTSSRADDDWSFPEVPLESVVLQVVPDLVRFEGNPSVSLAPLSGGGGTDVQRAIRRGDDDWLLVRRKGDLRTVADLAVVLELAVKPNGQDFFARASMDGAQLAETEVDAGASTARLAIPLTRLANGLCNEVEVRLVQAESIHLGDREVDESLDLKLEWLDGGGAPSVEVRVGASNDAVVSVLPGKLAESYLQRGTAPPLELSVRSPVAYRWEAKLLLGDEVVSRSDDERALKDAMSGAPIVLPTAPLAARVFETGQPATWSLAVFSEHEGDLDGSREPDAYFAGRLVPVEPLRLRVADAGALISNGSRRLLPIDVGSRKVEVEVENAEPGATLRADGELVPLVAEGGVHRAAIPIPEIALTHGSEVALEIIVEDARRDPLRETLEFVVSTRPPVCELLDPLSSVTWRSPDSSARFPLRVAVEGGDPNLERLIASVEAVVSCEGWSSATIPLKNDAVTIEGESAPWKGEVEIPFRYGGRKLQVRVEVRDHAGRKSTLEAPVDVDVVPYSFQPNIEVELSEGVTAPMVFVSAAAAELQGYRMLQWDGATSWDALTRELEGCAALLGEASSEDRERFEAIRAIYAAGNRGRFVQRFDSESWLQWAVRGLDPPRGDHSYYLDQDEVSIRQFRAFLDDPAFGAEQWWPLLDEADRSALALERRRSALVEALDAQAALAGADLRPVTGADWHEANAFALWSGRQLQSWFHWEYAFRRRASGNRFFGDVGELLPTALQPTSEAASAVIRHLASNATEWTCTPQLDRRRYARDDVFGSDGRRVVPGQAPGGALGYGFVLVGGSVDASLDQVYFDSTAAWPCFAARTISRQSSKPGFRCALPVGTTLTKVLDESGDRPGRSKLVQLGVR